jgi:hypothetical protein
MTLDVAGYSRLMGEDERRARSRRVILGVTEWARTKGD